MNYTTAALVSTFFCGVVAAQTAPPAISVAPSPRAILQTGEPTHAYWLLDNRWGDLNTFQNEQQIGAGPKGPSGEISYRLKWQWTYGSGGVKGYPAAVYGRRPGDYCPHMDQVGCWLPVKLPDGSILHDIPAGKTPGTVLPLQLPLAPGSLNSKFAFVHNTPPTGSGQLSYDIWLQSEPGQDHGFTKSSITHEIMIPLANWGNYGGWSGPNSRPPKWYDHDAWIDGRLYHVYATKGDDGALRYDWQWLEGTYGRTGWKLIAFVPAQMPINAGELNLASFVNYLATRKDIYGTPWATGREYVSSVELGVEPVEGAGDITIYNYSVSSTSSPAPTLPPPTTAPSYTAPPSTGAIVPINSSVWMDANATAGVVKVEFRVNGVLICTDVQAPYGCYYQTDATQGKDYTIEIKSYDAMGNFSTVTRLATSAGTAASPPLSSNDVVTVTLPVNGSTVLPGSSVWMGAIAGTGVTRVDFYVNGTPVCGDISIPYGCYFQTNSTTGAKYVIEARARNTSGNVSSSFATVSAQ